MHKNLLKQHGLFIIFAVVVVGVLVATSNKTADKNTVTYPQDSYAAKEKCTTTFIVVAVFSDQVQPSLPEIGNSEAVKVGANCGKVVVEKKGGQSKRGAFLVNSELELIGSGNTFIDGDKIDKIEFTVQRGTETVVQQEVDATKQENGGKRGKAFWTLHRHKLGHIA